MSFSIFIFLIITFLFGGFASDISREMTTSVFHVPFLSELSPDFKTITFLSQDQTRTSSFQVEVADSLTSREKGLMYRSSIAKYHGMIFLFSDEKPRSFWMKNTRIPLDMIFVAENGKVVHIEHGAQSCDESITSSCPLYSSGAMAKYVVELSVGESAKFDIEEGDQLVFPYLSWKNYSFEFVQ